MSYVTSLELVVAPDRLLVYAARRRRHHLAIAALLAEDAMMMEQGKLVGSEGSKRTLEMYGG